MKLLVTGGAGFIGSHLVEQLLLEGHEVVTLDDLSTGNLAYISNLMQHKRHTFICGSVLNRSLVNDAMDGCDAVFHLAAKLGVKSIVEEPLKIIESNIDSTRNILELAYARKIKVIFASTSEIYGKNDAIPYREDADRVVGQTNKNRWCYSTAKALDEHLCFAYSEKGLPITIVRYFNAYGPRAIGSDYGMVIPKFIMAALSNQPITVYGDGTQTRCFTHVHDTVKGTLLCLNQRYDKEVFNIGSNEEISIKEIANMIKVLCNSTSEITYIPYKEAYGESYEDIPRRVPDVSKSKNKLGFSTTIPFEKGLIQTIEWFKANVNEAGLP